MAIDDLDEDAYVLVRTGIKFQSMVKWLGRVATLTKSRSLARPHTKLKKWKFNLRGDWLNDGTLVVQASRVGENTTFGQLIELIEEVQDSQTQAQRKIDQFAKYYTPIVLVIFLIVFIFSQ